MSNITIPGIGDLWDSTNQGCDVDGVHLDHMALPLRLCITTDDHYGDRATTTFIKTQLNPKIIEDAG